LSGKRLSGKVTVRETSVNHNDEFSKSNYIRDEWYQQTTIQITMYSVRLRCSCVHDGSVRKLTVFSKAGLLQE